MITPDARNSHNGEAANRKLATAEGAPAADDNNVITAGPRSLLLIQDIGYQEKLAHFHREPIPERRMHAKGSGAYGTFTMTNDITRYTRASIFAEVGKQTEMFVRFTQVGIREFGGSRLSAGPNVGRYSGAIAGRIESTALCHGLSRVSSARRTPPAASRRRCHGGQEPRQASRTRWRRRRVAGSVRSRRLCHRSMPP
jgi:hypothetical protein